MSKLFQVLTALSALTVVVGVGGRAEAQEDDLVVPAEPPAGAPSPAPAPTALAPSRTPASETDTASDDVRADVRALRDEVRDLRARQEEKHPFLELWDTSKSAATPWDIPGRNGIWLLGYIQSQYETHQDSQNQLSPSGSPLNKDRFVIRRARLKLLAEWDFAEAMIEINGDTENGPNLNLQHAEASLHYRPDPTKVPIVQATLGLLDTPFGYELDESPRWRPFMERTTASRALWPGEPDLGLRVSGGLGFFRWTISTVNGFPLGSPSYALQDPISAKDVLFRFGVDTSPRPGLAVTGDVSALEGTGFHPGTAATKASIQWNDVGQTGIVQPSQLVGVPAEAATPSQTFSHWAVGASLQAVAQTPIGQLKVYGEIVIAQNLDRSLFIADPVQSGTNVRELGWYVAATQEVMKYGLVGFRYDSYNPNADFFDRRSGLLIPTSQTIETYSPLFGAVLPYRAKALVQYDIIRNHYGRDAEGVPTNLKMNTLTLRLEVDL